MERCKLVTRIAARKARQFMAGQMGHSPLLPIRHPIKQLQRGDPAAGDSGHLTPETDRARVASACQPNIGAKVLWLDQRRPGGTPATGAPRRERLTADDYRTEMTRRFAVCNEVTGLIATA